MPEDRFLIRKTGHTGPTVASVDELLTFWVGVHGAVMSNAMPAAADGYQIGLLEFKAPDDRTELVRRPCDVGATYFAVDEMGAVLSRPQPAGWIRKGTPQCVPSGMVVTHARDPDGRIIEVMQPPAALVTTPMNLRSFP